MEDLASLLDKVPLAEAVTVLGWHSFPDDQCNALYDRHRGRGYQREFTFANLLHLVTDALCRNDGRARLTLRDHQSSDRCPGSVQAFYGKLRRMPIAVSEAYVVESTRRLRGFLPDAPAVELPASLAAFRVLAIDGKTFKHAAKRLLPLRGQAGRGLGGKALVALEIASGLIVGMVVDPDGYANEAKLTPKLLPMLRTEADRQPRLWMADRGFGDLAQVRRCTEGGDHCVLRLHAKSRFTPDSQHGVGSGRDRQQREWIDEQGILKSVREGEMTVRRIILRRPDGDPLVIVTDLLDVDAYPANELLELYRQRWGIEMVFQKVSEVFHLRQLIGGSPEAIAFQAAVCMSLYNQLQVIRGLIAQTQNRPSSALSTHMLFADLHKQLLVLSFFAPPATIVAAWLERLATIPEPRMHLLQILSAAWTIHWIKSPPKKRSLTPNKPKKGSGGHFSIHRVLLKDKMR